MSSKTVHYVHFWAKKGKTKKKNRISFDRRSEDREYRRIYLGRSVVPKVDAQSFRNEHSISRDRDNVIDLRGAAKLTETSVFATLGDTASTLPRVASTRVGMKAYRTTLGKEDRPLEKVGHLQRAPETYLADTRTLRSEAAIKKVKLSVLRALHAQSNAGSVNIREVSAALDKILREP